MHLSLWIIAAGLLRLLPSCTGSPIAAVAIPSSATTRQNATAAGPCGNPEASGTSADCWTTLGMDNFLVNWTRKTVMAGAPMIGTIVCRPTEDWAQCFIRFAYGHQTMTAAPMDCVSLKSTSCKTPSKAVIKPTSPEFWYGLQAIFSIFTYSKTLTAALLSVTGNPDTLQKVYTSTFYSNNAAEAPNPVDLVLAALVGLKDGSVQDAQFYAYILSNPYPGNFSTTAARTPSDENIYEALVTSLEARLKKIMGSWTEFQSVLGDGAPWVSGVQAPASQYVEEWTDISPVAGGFLDAIGSSGVSTS